MGNVIGGIRREFGDQAYIIVCVRSPLDPTIEASKIAGADAVIVQPTPGYGLAHRTAISFGLTQLRGCRDDPEVSVVMVDADDTYDLSKVRMMVEIAGSKKLVVGDRFQGRGIRRAMPLVNYIGNKILSLLFKVVTGVKVEDTQSGLKVFPASLAEKFRMDGMEFSTEVIVRALERRLEVVEVPVEYRPRRGSHSKLNRVRDFVRIAIFMLKEGCRARSLRLARCQR